MDPGNRRGPTATNTQAGPPPWLGAVLVSRMGAALGLFAAPLVGLPALDLPGFFGHAFFAAAAPAEILGWIVFSVIGGLWVWVFRQLAPATGPLSAAALAAALNWGLCGLVALPTAPHWGPRVAAGLEPAPGWLGLSLHAGAPWTLLLAFALSAPGLLLASPLTA